MTRARTYGHFPGGDPRDVAPDPEGSTAAASPDEAAWSSDLESEVLDREHDEAAR